MRFMSQRRAMLAGMAAMGGMLMLPRAQAQQARNAADTLAADPRFSRFLDLATRAGAVEAMRAPGPLCVFAPVNDAFAGEAAGQVSLLTQGSTSGDSSQTFGEGARERVLQLVRAHIVEGHVSHSHLTGGNVTLRTLAGGQINSSTAGGTTTLTNPAMESQMSSFFARAGHRMSNVPARLLGGPINATNGVIYPVSQIIWP